MFRDVVLAVLLSVCAWAPAAQFLPEPSHALVPAASAETGVHPVDSDSTDDPDGQWNAAARAAASITESVWKFSVVHADLAGARCSRLTAPAVTIVSPDLRTRPAPGRLLSLPLLI